MTIFLLTILYMAFIGLSFLLQIALTVFYFKALYDLLSHMCQHDQELWNRLGQPRLLFFNKPVKNFIAQIKLCLWLLKRQPADNETGILKHRVQKWLLLYLVAFSLLFLLFAGPALYLLWPKIMALFL